MFIEMERETQSKELHSPPLLLLAFPSTYSLGNGTKSVQRTGEGVTERSSR